jgi:Trypsin
MRVILLLVVLASCGATQLGVANYEDPRTAGGGPHRHNDDTIDLPDDESAAEPEHPMVQSVQERATAHVHTPKDICSGMVIGPNEVMTAHQCMPDVMGVVPVTDKDAWRVEVASTSLTWTARHVSFVVTPNCEWKKLDAAVLVLDEPADWIVPLKVSTAPSSGATVQAMGFGRCRNERRRISERTGQVLEREADALEVDIGLCQGDVGGGFVDTAAGLVGIVSHQDDPDNADKHTTTGFRVDTSAVRRLLDVAATVAKSGGQGVVASTCE